MSKVLIPLADGFEEIEAVSIVDVLRRGGVEVVTAAIGGSLTVRGAHGMVMFADVSFADVENREWDAIILPGGGEGTERLKNSTPLILRLQRQNAEGRLLCAICAAPTVLASAGVVAKGLRLTCYPSCGEALDRPWDPALVVIDGNIITSQSPGTAIRFALTILRVLAGESTARSVASGMVLDIDFR